MKTLARHIEQLLLSNDCVIIPDFGGFVAHHVAATFDEQEQLFLPPHRTIGFNPQLTMNDSLLAQQYVQAADISYPEAMRMIEDAVERLRIVLETDGQFLLDGIGTLSLNEEGNREFTPAACGISSPAYYGLSFVELAPLKELPVPEEEETTEDSEEEEVAETVEIRKSTLQLIAAACVAIVLFFTLPNTVQAPLNATLANVDSGKMLLKVLPKTEVRGTVADLTLQQAKPSVQEKSVPVPEKTTTPAVMPTPQSYYTLVLATDVSKRNAAAFVESLSAKGFPQASVRDGKRRRIVYGVFASESEAYRKLAQLRSNREFADAWVMKIKE